MTNDAIKAELEGLRERLNEGFSDLRRCLEEDRKKSNHIEERVRLLEVREAVGAVKLKATIAIASLIGAGGVNLLLNYLTG